MTRDKRGYESTLVMHTYRASSGAQRGRVLYVFRSPSNLHIGRRALEGEVKEALEHTHPDLNFDWSALAREPGPRANFDDDFRPAPVRRPAPRPAGAPAPTPVVLDDQTLVGRTLGAERAARMRAQLTELLQRIARRARTPEERDRLTERAARLNPDDWADEAAIQAGARTFDADCTAIASELPRRRRGRRGGRRAAEGRQRIAGETAGPAVIEADPGASGIMAEGGEDDAGAEEDGLDREDRGTFDRSDDPGVGPDAEPEARGGEGADPDEPAGNGFSGDS
ncbi:MAG TPA: hypothetical protein VLT86_05785 [Vicinamibacterales bacterium]|nr:hypothetical protein [Vicinamibacterales bacterium]